MALIGVKTFMKDLNHYTKLLPFRRFHLKVFQISSSFLRDSSNKRHLSQMTPSCHSFNEKDDNHIKAKKLFNLLKVGESVSFDELMRNLGSSGIRINDPRLNLLQERAEERRLTVDLNEMDFENFRYLISGCENLTQKAICDDFVIPDFSLFCNHLNDIYQECRTNLSGVESSWPYADNTSQHFSYGVHGSDYWGVSVCSVDGQRHDIGDFDVSCPLHSCSWPFNYAFATKQLGFKEIHRFVDKEEAYAIPTVDGSLDFSNPLNILGSLLVSSLMLKNASNLEDKFVEMFDGYEQLIGRKGGLKFSKEVFNVANTWSHKTKSVAHYLVNKNYFPEGVSLDDILTLQLQSNCLSVDVQSAAVMAATLANYGRCPNEDSLSPVLEPLAVRNILTFMQSSYQFSRDLRLPVMSSLTGMNMVVINGVMGLCLWSPPLDKFGNSIRSMQFCKELAKRFTVHKFNLSNVKSKQIYLGNHKSFGRASHIGWMMYCAYSGDEQSLRILHSSGLATDLCDCDGRTALHVACSEGHLGCVKYLVDVCHVPLDIRDRWGNTPLNEALRYHHKDVQSFLESRINLS